MGKKKKKLNKGTKVVVARLAFFTALLKLIRTIIETFF